MRYFKNSENNIYAYDDNQLTAAEKQAKVDAAQSEYDQFVSDATQSELAGAQSAYQSIASQIQAAKSEAAPEDAEPADVVPTDADLAAAKGRLDKAQTAHQDYLDQLALKAQKIDAAKSIKIYIKEGLTEIDNDEYQALIAPTAAEKQATAADSVRHQRDTIVDRVSREINRLEDAGTDASDWRQYRVALRNVPEQDGFPFDITWPEQPADYTGK